MGEWKEIESSVWKPTKEEEVLEGVLVNEEEGKDGKKKYNIDNGKDLITLWGTSILNERLDEVNIGQKVRITYNGEKNTGKPNPLKLFKVEVWEDQEEKVE